MITRKAQKNQNRLEYGFRVILDVDQSTQSITSPLNAYSTEENSVVGTWVLLERSTVPSGVCRSKRALTSNVRQKGSYRYKSTARVPYRHRYYVQYRYVLVAVRGHFGYIPGFIQYRYVLVAVRGHLVTSPGLIGYKFSRGYLTRLL